jgi:hypothetical protein
MSISLKGSFRMLAMGALAALPGLAMPGLARAAEVDSPLSLSSPSQASTTANTAAEPDSGLTLKPKYLADGPPAPNVHGFLSLPFKTAYVTPRGLVVENAGVVIQPVGGFVFPIGDVSVFKNLTIITGIWSSFNSAQDDPLVGWLNEIDYFLTASADVTKEINLALTYSPWFFPQSTAVAKPKTEHNIDLKATYHDSWFKEFTLNPYVDLWWAVAGSSTVVLGDTGSTGYVEVGVTPTKTFNVKENMPVTVTLPTYISFGPKEFWDATGAFGGNNFGLFSISANASMPMPWISSQYGHWHMDAGITYDYLINDALLAAGGILSGNDNRNVFIASVGVGVNF